MKHPPLLFLDCETLGLDLAAPIWEIGAFRVEEGMVINASIVHLFVEHDPRDAEGNLWLDRLPAKFAGDYEQRFIVDDPLTVSPETAVGAISYAARRGALICGSNPGFDMQRIEAMAAREGVPAPPWHYHPEDVPTLARGWLAGKGVYPAPPWKSDLISQMCGVDPTAFERHTALGDCWWSWELWKAVQR